MMEEDSNKKKRKRLKSDYCTKYYAPYCYWKIRKLYPNIKIHDIHKALNLYYNLAQEDLALGRKITLSNRLGCLYLSKELRGVEYNPETNKIRNTFPVNINETLKLWKQKPELKHKTFVRFTNEHSDNYTFRLHFQSSKAIFKNKHIYTFHFNKMLKHKLNLNIKAKKVDAYLINKGKNYE